MQFKAENSVSICHYSTVNPFKCEIIKTDDDTLTIKLVKQFAFLDFLEGDPAVIIIKEREKVYNIGCNIISIKPKENILVLRIDSLEPEAEQRRHERHPVSLYADVRLKGKDRKYIAIVKDISFFGMKIFCKESFDLDETLQMDLYMQQKIIFIRAIVLRKTAYPHYYEYGLRIEYDNYDTLNYIKMYIKNLSE